MKPPLWIWILILGTIPIPVRIPFTFVIEVQLLFVNSVWIGCRQQYAWTGWKKITVAVMFRGAGGRNVDWYRGRVSISCRGPSTVSGKRLHNIDHASQALASAADTPQFTSIFIFTYYWCKWRNMPDKRKPIMWSGNVFYSTGKKIYEERN